MKITIITSVIGLSMLPSAVSALVSNAADLPVDENGRLKNNFLLYDGSNPCSSKIGVTEFPYRDSIPIAKELAQQYFGTSAGHCATVCLEKGMQIEYVMHPLPMHVNAKGDNFNNFVMENCQRVEAGILNYQQNEVVVHWIDFDGTRVTINTVKRGEKNTAWQNTFLGHSFEVTDAVTDELLLKFTVSENVFYHIGELPSAIQERDVDFQIKNTFDIEWKRAHVVTRTFTELGFDKGRLPDDLWASISAYYYNNRDNKVLEEWGGKGVYVNWWERDVYFIPMPWNLKTYWQTRLKELVEGWSGVELELTDIYGMRRYEDGARLLTHVDREQTHAASLIINVAQGAIRSPWKVEIYDFADRLHEIEMEPGDIVYYESARCLHGRMRPLDGGFYVNLFAHYRPVGDPQWYVKKNPPEAPPHLLDIGQCQRVSASSAECYSPSDGSVNQQVPYLSPSLSQLTAAKDLYQYWRSVAPTTTAEQGVGKDEL